MSTLLGPMVIEYRKMEDWLPDSVGFEGNVLLANSIALKDTNLVKSSEFKFY